MQSLKYLLLYLLYCILFSPSVFAYTVGWEKKELLASPKEEIHYTHRAEQDLEEINLSTAPTSKGEATSLYQYFTVETGYQKNAAQKNPYQFQKEDYKVTPVDAVEPDATKYIASSIQTKGWHADVMGFLPFPNELPFNLIGSVGLSSLKLTHETNASSEFFKEMGRAAALDKSLKKNEYEAGILRIGGGVEYHPHPDFGFRTSLTWENTAKFRELVPEGELQEEGDGLDFKDTLKPSFGVFVKF